MSRNVEYAHMDFQMCEEDGENNNEQEPAYPDERTIRNVRPRMGSHRRCRSPFCLLLIPTGTLGSRFLLLQHRCCFPPSVQTTGRVLKAYIICE